ncbi:MAG TPA: hypothetical protein VLF89_01715 [Candidatus Saccharimonadales bacterium]|nr:hypothetical protein [Candidatus Saccharimonadales bacterium]
MTQEKEPESRELIIPEAIPRKDLLGRNELGGILTVVVIPAIQDFSTMLDDDIIDLNDARENAGNEQQIDAQISEIERRQQELTELEALVNEFSNNPYQFEAATIRTAIDRRGFRTHNVVLQRKHSHIGNTPSTANPQLSLFLRYGMIEDEDIASAAYQISRPTERSSLGKSRSAENVVMQYRVSKYESITVSMRKTYILEGEVVNPVQAGVSFYQNPDKNNVQAYGNFTGYDRMPRIKRDEIPDLQMHMKEFDYMCSFIEIQQQYQPLAFPTLTENPNL